MPLRNLVSISGVQKMNSYVIMELIKFEFRRAITHELDNGWKRNFIGML